MSKDIALWRTRACHCLAARRKARAITRLYEDKLRRHGLRATQFSVLAALHLKRATPVSELAELLGLERTTLTRSARVLEGRRWVETASSDDARQRPLRITPDGLARLEAAFADWSEVQERIDRGDWKMPG